jgi:hypothetical protein
MGKTNRKEKSEWGRPSSRKRKNKRGASKISQHESKTSNTDRVKDSLPDEYEYDNFEKFSRRKK